MAKFKVGDKVRVRKFETRPDHWSDDGGMDHWMGEIVTLETIDQTRKNPCSSRHVTSSVDFSLREDKKEFRGVKWVWKESDFELIKPRREFIVINRSGNVMTAEHRVNREIIKSAKATCALSDTFDFDAGAKLAFDRLMGREEPKPAPAPEPPKFYTGKVVMTACEYFDREPHIGRLFEFKNGKYVGSEVQGFVFFGEPYKSFNDIAKTHSRSTWIEVKE